MSQLALNAAEPEATAPAAPELGQALLFSSEIEKRLEVEEGAGRYTLERFKLLRPDAYQACIEELAKSKPGYEGLRRIAGHLKVHWLTVAAVRDEPAAGETIDTLRGKLVKKLALGAELLADRILESPDMIPANVIGLNIDVLLRNVELLSGRATSRTEHTERVDIHATWDAVRQALPSEKQLDASQVRELQPAVIDLVGGKISDSSGPGSEPIAGPSDAESLAPGDHSEASEATDTDIDADRAADLADEPADRQLATAAARARSQGRGGVGASIGEASDLIDPSSQKFSSNDPPSAP